MDSLQNKELNEPLLESKKLPPVAAAEVSSELEEILSDTTLSWWRRFQKAIVIELKYLFRLAGPAVIVYLLNNVTSMSTQIFCGHLGNLELAASSLGNNGKCSRNLEFFKLSSASAVMLCLEIWYFQVLVLIAGLLPDPEVALDSLAICLTINGWSSTVSVGFNAAVSVRVSNELGAKHPKSAAFSVVVSTVTSVIISVIFAIITLVLRHQLSYPFTSGKVVSDVVSDLTPLLAAALVLNRTQPVLSGNVFLQLERKKKLHSYLL
ncbi:hypothetical protein Pfo_013819 [Paulownia fortunei]|nr:hypothetical protein Pfo_013819 [Paulownia fortunei]